MDKLQHRLLDLAAKREKIHMVKYLNFTTFDIMADMTFGEPLGLLDGSPASSWIDAFSGFIRFITLVRVADTWPSLKPIFKALVSHP